MLQHNNRIALRRIRYRHARNSSRLTHKKLVVRKLPVPYHRRRLDIPAAHITVTLHHNKTVSTRIGYRHGRSRQNGQLFRTESIRKYGCFQECDFGPGPEHEFGEDVTLNLRLILAETFMVIAPPAARYHSECSQIGGLTRAEPLEVFLARPEVVTDYCPPEKQELMKNVLDHMALRWAQTRARHGYKTDAIALLQRFPDVRAFRWKYYRCLMVVALSRWYPYWVRFKCAFGPPARLFLRKMGAKLRLFPAPPKVNTPEE